MVGLSRFELLTPRLSSVCSNQLSYRPSRMLSPETVASTCQRTGSRFSKTRQNVCTIRCIAFPKKCGTEYQIDHSIGLRVWD